ncbi:syndecan isoform X2 [Thrips palmi]|uniref:Syndecan n=1 Tax=Thrips palmi TaxID=161013 RepID=A0A6P9A579_THRPL|nr:syndecan isoform X2 [Thrips palmi]
MHLRIYTLLIAALLVGYTTAEEVRLRRNSVSGDMHGVQVRSTSKPWESPKSKDDLYLDDAADGSGDGDGDGPRGEFKGDLEASGSGSGPSDDDDDEDYARKGPQKPSPDVTSTSDRNRLEETVVTRTQANNEQSPVFPEKDLSNSNSNQDITLGGGSSSGSGSSGSGPKSQPPVTDIDDNTLGSGSEDERMGNEGVYIMSNKPEERAASFFAQPGILAAVIGGAVVGLLCAILVVMFIVYRMRKKDEGSYALDEPKRSPTVNSYSKNTNREFFA